MTNLSEVLKSCVLFEGLTSLEMNAVASQIRFASRTYARDEVVAFEEDPCAAVGIVTTGSIHIQRMFPNGKIITLETFYSGDSFGEALVFADNGDYPATLLAREDTHVIYIDKAAIIDLCSRYPRFLNNVLRALSNKLLMLNRKIKSLTFTSLRQKVANFLIDESHRQDSLNLVLNISRAELADFLAIPRPSLSRELVSMQQDSIIHFERRVVSILDYPALQLALEG